MTGKRKDYTEAVIMYRSGLSIQQTANIYGITRQAMHKILKRRNVVFRSNLKFGLENHFYNGGYDYDVRVRSMTQTAINSGKLIKENCEACGAERVDAHHDNYNNPFSIRWLCRKHHAEWHENNRPIRRTVEFPPMQQEAIARMGGIQSGINRRSKRGEK